MSFKSNYYEEEMDPLTAPRFSCDDGISTGEGELVCLYEDVSSAVSERGGEKGSSEKG